MTGRQMRLVHVMTVPESFAFLAGQIGYMQEHGFAVEGVVSPGELFATVAERERIPLHPVPMARQITPLKDLVALYRLWALFRRIRPDIVHAHTPKGGLLGTIAAWLTRVPVKIYHIHGLPFVTATGPKRALLRWTERISCLLSDQVLCVSHSVRNVLIAEQLCSPRKVKVLLGGSSNGVDAEGRFNPDAFDTHTRLSTRAAYGIPAGATVIGFVGRIVKDKGISELAEAWTKLSGEFPELHLLVVGPFEPQDPISATVETLLRSDPRVHLAGRTLDVAPLYSAMDIVVLPTYREGFPNVPLEAAAMRLPVVATRIPGCTDAVLDGVTGLLVSPRDAAELAAAIRGYVVDEELRRRHGSAGRERVLLDFRRPGIWEAVRAEYLRLVGLTK
ncbi:MAG: glycosyltransferase family 4 protein [Mycobacterium leprae]